ncbi:fructokinase [Sporobacter termitidis DSM 10068]|uniref:Fructokinase n=1 Tax=Sporobacter termitidis DSM 10068 TaxID=1123282 RepID=A0A1M5YML6_9FIRM|nr:carbohydrate kinase [Sporobacter termitidis]SHI12803.1 fructokinase [Sporobacter termitidis DSM 10068]
MPCVLSAGELLIDFSPAGWSDNNQPLYEQNPGGAPANVAVGLSRLGVDSGFIGKVGSDSFGCFLKGTLDNCGVRTKGLKYDAAATTLAFVQLAESGERSFSFYRNPGADTRLAPADLDFAEVDRCDVLHFGALLFTAEPARSAMLALLEYAREKGKLISYDPNWRPALWRSCDEGLRDMRRGLAYADIVKVSGEELFLLTESADIRDGVNKLLVMGARLVLVTLGAEGCRVATRRCDAALPAFNVDVLDTTGCGDAAMAGCLCKILALGKGLDDLDADGLRAVAAYANACGALCATKRGAMPALPTRVEVDALLRR